MRDLVTRFLPLTAILCPLALQSVILLVQRDCDITLTDNNGYLASHHAARHNKLDCLRFLVKQGSNIEATQADGKSPSHVVNAFHSCTCTSNSQQCFWMVSIYIFLILTFCNFVILMSLWFSPIEKKIGIDILCRYLPIFLLIKEFYFIFWTFNF